MHYFNNNVFLYYEVTIGMFVHQTADSDPNCHSFYSDSFIHW
jgi:hypothetical protein